jgi:hypothetical protein
MIPFESLFRFAACGGTAIFPGGPGLYDGLSCTSLGNPALNSLSDILKVAGNALRILIALSGGLAIIVIVVASIYYITSAGDPGRIKRAKDILVNVATGLLLILVSYAVITFIVGGFA